MALGECFQKRKFTLLTAGAQRRNEAKRNLFCLIFARFGETNKQIFRFFSVIKKIKLCFFFLSVPLAALFVLS
jgi:hypothetical protein